MVDLNLHHMPQPPRRKDFRIGVIGAGFIVRDVHLVAYERAGFNVQALACADPAQAREVAAARRVPKAYDTVAELLRDESLEVLDIAVPPREQPGVMREVVHTPATSRECWRRSRWHRITARPGRSSRCSRMPASC